MTIPIWRAVDRLNPEEPPLNHSANLPKSPENFLMSHTISTMRILLLAFCLALPTTGKCSAEAVFASGEASVELLSATGGLSVATLELGSSVVITLGQPIAEIVVTSAAISADTVAFSASKTKKFDPNSSCSCPISWSSPRT